jgi:nicotinamide-nucleotide adenylyltransferase
MPIDPYPIQPARFARIGAIARWKPVHLGHAAMLEAIADRADKAVIGIGSANRYDARNPFTSGETAEMIRLVLEPRENFELVEIDDLDDPPRWRELAIARLGPLDLFVTANEPVRRLLERDYRIAHPLAIVPSPRRTPVDGTMVRRAMARGDGWEGLVPPAIAAYIRSRGIDRRFRAEFGLETLARSAEPSSLGSGR